MNDIGIWDRALTENEVLELYLQLKVVLTHLHWYNADANVDDGSCYPIIEGCMNPIAANYVSQLYTHIDINTEDILVVFSSSIMKNNDKFNLEEELAIFETIEEEQDYL